MNIIDVTNKTTSNFDLDRSITGFRFQSSLSINELTTEKIKITVVRQNNGQNLSILEEFIPLAQFVLASTMTGSPISSYLPDYKTEVYIPLTLSGAIMLQSNDRLRFELIGLKTSSRYVFSGYEGSFGAVHAMTYVKRNAQKDSTLIDFNATGYDLGVMEKTDDIALFKLFYENGAVTEHLPDEFYSRMELACGVLQFTDVVVLRPTNYVQIPLIGIKNIQLVKQTATTVTNILLRRNTVN